MPLPVRVQNFRMAFLRLDLLWASKMHRRTDHLYTGAAVGAPCSLDCFGGCAMWGIAVEFLIGAVSCKKVECTDDLTFPSFFFFLLLLQIPSLSPL